MKHTCSECRQPRRFTVRHTQTRDARTLRVCLACWGAKGYDLYFADNLPVKAEYYRLLAQ